MRKGCTKAPARRWLLAALITLLALLVPQAVIGQGSQPVGTLFFFGTGVTGTIPLTLQVTGTPFDTTKGTSKLDWLSLLYFTAPGGGIITATAPAATHTEIQPIQCLSRSGVAIAPIPVVPVETLALPLEQSSSDVRPAGYDLTRPGTYSVNARIPFTLVEAGGLITDCDQAPGITVVNVAPGAPGRQEFTTVSNSLVVRICCYTFVGFVSPLGPEAICSVSVCLTAKVGRSIPVKFQLFDPAPAGTIVKRAVAFLSLTQLSGALPPAPPGEVGPFDFEEPTQHYHLTYDTSRLTPGVWRFDVRIDDGSVHSALFELQ